MYVYVYIYIYMWALGRQASVSPLVVAPGLGEGVRPPSIVNDDT